MSPSYLTGARLAILYRTEAHYTFGTGDKGRKCRAPEAIQARKEIDAILAEIDGINV